MSSEVSLEAREQPGFLRRLGAGCARAACSQLGLVVLVVVYVLLGAVLFEYLESGPEVQKKSAIQRSREECLKELWAITGTDNNHYEDDPAFQQNSQPFTYDSQDYEELETGDHNNGRIKQLLKKSNETLILSKEVTTQTEKNEADVHKPITEEQSNSVEDKNAVSTSCIHCVFERKLDKRNYDFGNLLIGELQFVPACMRSEVYINILKYVKSLYNKHLEESS